MIMAKDRTLRFNPNFTILVSGGNSSGESEGKDAKAYFGIGKLHNDLHSLDNISRMENAFFETFIDVRTTGGKWKSAMIAGPGRTQLSRRKECGILQQDGSAGYNVCP